MKSTRARSPSSSNVAKRLKSDAPLDVAAFIFRRDFRVDDNTALLALSEKAIEKSIDILPLFFFNPVQCDEDKNAYFGKACFQFLCESLEDLDQRQLKGNLVCLRGTDEECLQTVKRCGFNVRLIGYNEDFTPFSLVRDAQLRRYCDSQEVDIVSSAEDYTLLPLDTVVRDNEQPYAVFTAFYKRLMSDFSAQIKKPQKPKRSLPFVQGAKAYFGKQCQFPLYETLPQISDHGGREEGLQRMANIPNMRQYAEERNRIPDDLTSHLSPHLKFGTVSIREVWDQSVRSLGRNHDFVRQLIWREFYCSLVYHHPRLVKAQLHAYPGSVLDTYRAEARAPAAYTNQGSGNDPFMAKYIPYVWKWRERDWEAFQRGEVGVPLVDAAVRCLKATGWCHNRCRMVIANFLVKVLHVDWRVGERWYATVAVDFDVANNSGGWLWSSGQGADAQPYLRTFNPFRQSANFDPDCVFIYQWVPELREVPPEVIHRWEEYCTKHKLNAGVSLKDAKPKGTHSKSKKPMDQWYSTTYRAPIVDVKECTRKVIAEFKKYDPK